MAIWPRAGWQYYQRHGHPFTCRSSQTILSQSSDATESTVQTIKPNLYSRMAENSQLTRSYMADATVSRIEVQYELGFRQKHLNLVWVATVWRDYPLVALDQDHRSCILLSLECLLFLKTNWKLCFLHKHLLIHYNCLCLCWCIWIV